MAHERTIRRFRSWYAALLRLYPKPYRERFGEPMEQTFNDLLRERAKDERGLSGFALWMFVETFAGVIGENRSAIMMQRGIIRVALATALLLAWINLAVGIIGNEGNPANLMYIGVLAVGIVGALIARFQPRGMARAFFATALAQMLVAVIALTARLGTSGPVWPRELLIATGFFATLIRLAVNQGLMQIALRSSNVRSGHRRAS